MPCNYGRGFFLENAIGTFPHLEIICFFVRDLFFYVAILLQFWTGPQIAGVP